MAQIRGQNRSKSPPTEWSFRTLGTVMYCEVRDIVAIVTDTDVEDIHAETPLMEVRIPKAFGAHDPTGSLGEGSDEVYSRGCDSL